MGFQKEEYLERIGAYETAKRVTMQSAEENIDFLDLMKSLHGNDEIFTSFRWNPGHALDEIKSVYIQPREAGFHRESDFIYHRWISSVEDGFDCVIVH